MIFVTGAILYFRSKKDVMALKNAQTEAGLWLAQSPATLFRADDCGALKRFMQKALTEPTAIVPTPARNSFPKPKELGLPFERGWEALENNYERLTIFREAESYKINAYFPDGNWNAEQSTVFTGVDALDVTVDEIFSRMNPQQDKV